jgi:UDP-N-acetyl-2-amino-2-deoxyglucuronate dehydrogenase
MKNKVIKFGVVGYGHIGKRHAEMVRRNPDAELVAVCDILPVDKLGGENLDVPFFNNIDEMLNAGIEMDVVCICTPNGLHAEYSLKALHAHKHVVVEKPMALTKVDAEKMVFKSLEVSRHVFCVMQNRYSPPSAWLKQIVEDGTLGEIYLVQLNCYWNRDDRYYKKGNWHGDAKLDGGTLYTQFSHFIDIMYWLFGDVENIRGNFADFSHKNLTDFEDSGFVSFDFVNGGMGSINYSTSIFNTNFESSITIVGSNGTVKVAGQYMNEVVYCHVKDYEMPELAPSNPPNDYGAYKGSAQNHHLVIQNVVDKLQERGTISTNALEGLKVVDIIERIYAVRNKTFKK